MGRTWPIPFYRLSLILIYMTGNIFDKGVFLFKLYRFYLVVNTLYFIKTMTALTQVISEGKEGLKLIIDLIIVCYAIALLIVFGMVHEDMADLMRTLRRGLSDYSSLEISAERDEALRRTKVKCRVTEMIIISNSLKALGCFVLYPLLYEQEDISILRYILPNILGPPVEFALKFFHLLLNLVMGMSLTFFHNNWEIIMVNSISCLSGELGILTDSIATIDRRAQLMVVALRRDLGGCHWSTRVGGRGKLLGARRGPQRLLYDDRTRETCLFECLKESIRHHQALIKTTAKLNKIIGACLLIYTHTVGITVAICLFLIAQVDHFLSARVLLYCLILVPTMMGQGLLCIFGQELLDKSEELRYSLYTSDWRARSRRYVSCLRVMMLQCHRPLRLRSLIYTVNNASYVEFLKAGYSFLNFLLTMNSSRNFIKDDVSPLTNNT